VNFDRRRLRLRGESASQEQDTKAERMHNDNLSKEKMETAFDVTLVFSKKSTELALLPITEVTTRKSRAHTAPFGQVEIA